MLSVVVDKVLILRETEGKRGVEWWDGEDMVVLLLSMFCDIGIIAAMNMVGGRGCGGCCCYCH